MSEQPAAAGPTQGPEQPDEIHVRDGTGRNLCDRPGESITLTEALDPDDGKLFTCGGCWLLLADGAEPMGGSRP